MTPKPSKFAPYREALATLSKRTRTPLPSLVISFAILHELTAILPVAGFFYGCRALGVGESIVRAVGQQQNQPEVSGGYMAQYRDSWVGERVREWMVEGEVRAERVGRRYGWFGFEKGSTMGDSSPEAQSAHAAFDLVSGRIAGDVANAVVAYALTKALLPLRIGASLWLSPPFSRTFVQPIGSAISRMFRR
ncbi:hypothetical protein PYCCODRAFT_1439265 [Trametes coccinea BRFM310]|uniref:Uncharacterized protein n=1 Tax=Trametes coccinea (strain BRFM310) TaxID=1353009 RepID=A0A1Y2IBA1_TRAC3|nr:hypothetical protein PYCCODRAFT_1439265 [Trametes coccinea BRFM310]